MNHCLFLRGGSDGNSLKDDLSIGAPIREVRIAIKKLRIYGN